MSAVVITNPTPETNSSPLISLGKFMRVLITAGQDVRLVGARLRVNEIYGYDSSVPVRSYRYGGKGAIKLLSFIFLQISSFFGMLFSLKKGDSVYFWIGDKMLGPYLAAKCRRCQVNYFVYGRTAAEDRGISRRLISFFIKHADFVCAEGASVFSLWDIPAGKRRRVIPIPVPPSKAEPVPFCEREPILLFAGRLVEGKRPLTLIRAFAMLHAALPEYRLLLVGAGVLEEECRALAAQLQVQDAVEFTGWVSHSSLQELLSRARLLIHPSETEGVPGGILEAMALGVPVIASPVGGIPDVISDGVNGWLFPITDHESLADELLRLLTREDLRGISAAAAAHVRTNYTEEATAEAFLRSLTE